jgi:hypothetical protein
MRFLAVVVLLLGLQETPADPRVRDLVRRLEDDRLEEREAAAEALRNLDAGELPRLRPFLATLSTEARERLRAAIQTIEIRTRLAQVLPRTPMATLPERPQAFAQAFEGLRRLTKLPIRLHEDLGGLDRVVRPGPGRTTWWEALERLLAAHGAASIDVEEEEMRIVPGARRTGVHRGPHAAWLQRLRADQGRSFSDPFPEESCTADLAVAWEPGGPAPLRVRATILEASDDAGRVLAGSEEDDPEWVTAIGTDPKIPWRQLEIALPAAPAPDAAALARLRARVEFHYALDRGEFKIDVQTPGPRQATVGGQTLRLISLKSEEGAWNAHLRLEERPGEAADLIVESVKLMDKEGHAHEGLASSEVEEGEDGGVALSLSFPQVPPKAELRRLEVKLVTRTHVESLDLDLRDLPLGAP